MNERIDLSLAMHIVNRVTIAKCFAPAKEQAQKEKPKLTFIASLALPHSRWTMATTPDRTAGGAEWDRPGVADGKNATPESSFLHKRQNQVRKFPTPQEMQRLRAPRHDTGATPPPDGHGWSARRGRRSNASGTRYF